MSDTFLHIENGAHTGAFGNNPLPHPSDAMLKAGNYKKGRISLFGLPIAIEQPRGTYRTGIDQKTGKRWTSRMAAHYGYFERSRGNDGDGVDVFVGFYPQSEQAYVINQFIDGRYDEAKVMLAFPDIESAQRAYLDSYERGWKGLQSIIPLSISQLKWWLKNGDMSKPLRLNNLPPEGLETMSKRVYWNNDALPYDQSLDTVLYDIRRSENGNLLLDSVKIDDITEDSDGVMLLDAMVTPYAKLERKMEILRGVMERASTIVKPVAMQITQPFKQRGVANVATVFELSDGQTVSIYFHNPDVTPNKMTPTDELVSYSWLLNKKNITIVVAPERGEELDAREVARRIMKLAEKNSAAFARANSKRAERMQNIESLKNEITSLEKELADAQHELEVLKVEAETLKQTPQPDQDINAQMEVFVKEAALWKGAAIQVAKILEGDKKASLALSRMTTKADLDDYLMRKLNIDETTARDVSNTLTAQDIPADMSANLEDYKDEPWYSLINNETQGNSSREDTTDPEIKQDENKKDIVELTGKELGDFPDTGEGKVQLRAAAGEVLSALLGSWVPCPALGGDVEIRRAGIKEIISHSGDARKLKVVAAIDQIIGKAKKLGTRPPYNGDADKSARLYHTLRTEMILEDTQLAVRTVIKEDIAGKFHYDMTIHDGEAIFDGVQDKGRDESQPLSMTTTNGGGTYPSRIARHQLSSTLTDDKDDFNQGTVMGGSTEALDSAGGKMVFNLFIEGEEPEVIEDSDDDQSEEINPNVSILQDNAEFSVGDTVYMQDITDENKRIPVNFRGYLNDRQSVVVWNGSQMTVETNRLFKDDIQSSTDSENSIKSAFIAELEALKSETDINTFNAKLDDIAARIEQAGLMETLDAELNATADVLTRLLAEAEKGQ